MAPKVKREPTLARKRSRNNLQRPRSRSRSRLANSKRRTSQSEAKPIPLLPPRLCYRILIALCIILLVAAPVLIGFILSKSLFAGCLSLSLRFLCDHTWIGTLSGLAPQLSNLPDSCANARNNYAISINTTWAAAGTDPIVPNNITQYADIADRTQSPVKIAYEANNALLLSGFLFGRAEEDLMLLDAKLGSPPSAISDPQRLRNHLPSLGQLDQAHRDVDTYKTPEDVGRDSWYRVQKFLIQDAAQVKTFLADARSPLTKKFDSWYYDNFPDQYQSSPGGRILVKWLNTIGKQIGMLDRMINAAQAAVGTLEIMTDRLKLFHDGVDHEEEKWEADCLQWHPAPVTTSTITGSRGVVKTTTSQPHRGTPPIVALSSAKLSQFPVRCMRPPSEILAAHEPLLGRMRWLHNAFQMLTPIHEQHRRSMVEFNTTLTTHLEVERLKTKFVYGPGAHTALDLETLMPLLDQVLEKGKEIEAWTRSQDKQRDQWLNQAIELESSGGDPSRILEEQVQGSDVHTLGEEGEGM